MRNILITSAIFLAGCSLNQVDVSTTSSPVTNEESSTYYTNVAPMPVLTAWKGAEGAKTTIESFAKCESASDSNEVTVDGKKFKNPTRCYLELLSNSDSETFVRSLSGNTKGQILSSSLSVEGQSYEVTMLWSKHTWMISPEENGGDEAKYKIGVGAKIVAKIFEAKGGLDLSDIPSLAASAEVNNLTGSISFKRIGINGKLTEIILPGFTDTLDTDAVLNAVQSMQKIQILLHSDKDVAIKPSVLGHFLPKPEDNNEEFSQGLGWIYIGHYPNKGSHLIPQFNISALGNEKIEEFTAGTVIKADIQKNIRADKPRFPYYSLAQTVAKIPADCKLQVHELDSVGKNKYWAYVSLVDDCSTQI